MVSGMNIATDTMFRSVKGHQIDIRCFMQDINGRLHVVVHPRRIGNQSHTLTFQALEFLFLQDFNTGLNLNLLSMDRTTQHAEQTNQKYFSHNSLLLSK